MSQKLNELRAACEGHIKAYNEALKKNDFKAMTTIEGNLKDAEGEYATQSRNELFDACKATSNPILEGVKRHNYPILRHRLVKDDGVITGMELVDDRVKQIDLVQLCKWCGLPVLWQYKVEKMGELLALRSARELGMTDKEIEEISRTYRMDKLAQSEKMGATPTSNTQICKLLQMCIDAMMAGTDAEGKLKANSHDVAYMLMCYTKRGRQQLYVTVSKASFLHNLVCDVLHRLATGKKYGLDYQKVKDAAPSTPEGSKSETNPKKAVKVSDEVSEPEVKKVPRPKKAKAAAEEVAA